ncbi:uncharacterized protein [Nicotiana tomentosiformis]|uniref:uncharacterized protein n=1 Tax=Nicotiana tomentosiformis TaxID=4098 RepID=UPI00388C9C30
MEIAQRIEGYRQRGREHMQRDKRVRYSGEFRGFFQRLLYAMPESSYRPPAIQVSSSGYSGHQGQTSGQKITVPRGCFECGNFSHVQRFYPKLQGKAVQQGQQPMITAPAIRPPRGRGQAGRGHPRGGVQAGGGQPAAAQTGGGQPVGAPARFYAFPARPDVVASDAVITSIISVYGRDALVLFYPGYSYSYVSSLFAHFLGIPRESLGTPVYVSTLVGDSVIVNRIYQSCVVIFYGYKTRSDLLLLDMTDFEVILGMDWLSQYHAIFDCHAKTVTLAMPELPRLEWKGSSVSAFSRVLYFLKAPHMVEKGMPPDHEIDFCIDLAQGTQSISIPPYRMDPKELKEFKEQLEELLAKGLVRPSISP